MSKRIIVATFAALFVAKFAFGITYSRPRQSPTPTPTPMQAQSPIPSQKTTFAPRTTPTPMVPSQKTTFAPRATPTPMIPARYAPAQQRMQPKPSPAPQQQQQQQWQQWQQQQRRMLSSATQPNPTPMPARYQARPTPTVALIPPKLAATPAPAPMKPTPAPLPPPDVNVYLDRQVANSKDKKFHMTVNGKDLGLTPFHVWPQKSTGPSSTSTSVSMRSDEGTVYDIDFETTGAQVSGIRIRRINGENLR